MDQQPQATYRVIGSNGYRERVCATGLTQEQAEQTREEILWGPITRRQFKCWIECEQEVQRPGY